MKRFASTLLVASLAACAVTKEPAPHPVAKPYRIAQVGNGRDAYFEVCASCPAPTKKTLAVFDPMPTALFVTPPLPKIVPPEPKKIVAKEEPPVVAAPVVHVVSFSPKSARIVKNTLSQMQALPPEVLKAEKLSVVAFSGHEGSSRHTRDLAEWRAQHVKQWLVAHGMSKANVETDFSHCCDKSESAKSGRPRVEIHVIAPTVVAAGAAPRVIAEKAAEKPVPAVAAVPTPAPAVPVPAPVVQTKAPAAPAATNAAPAAGKDAVPQKRDEPAVHVISFNYKSSHPAADALNELQELLPAALKAESITVSSFTDGTGSRSYNRRLAGRRANNIKKWLVEQGVREEIIVVDNGKCCDAVDQSAEQSRRAEIRFRLPPPPKGESA